MPDQCLEGLTHLVEHHIRRTISISSILLIVVLTFSLAQVHGSEWGDVPALKDLDFSNVEIHSLIAVQTRNGRQDSDHLIFMPDSSETSSAPAPAGKVVA